MIRFDFADLKLFKSIVDAGSISQGAAQSHLALSSASERLKNMEQQLGLALFIRHARGITLTDAGEIFLKHAQKMLDQQQKMLTELKDFQLGKIGSIEFYSNTSALSEFLPAKVSAWLQKNPQFKIELKESNSEQSIQKIQEGLIEAAMISNAVAPSDLIFDPIYQDQLVLVVPPKHPLQQMPKISFHALIHEPFVGLFEGSALHLHIAAHAQSLGYQLNIRVRMNTFEGICEMVDKAIGIAIVPKRVAEKHQNQFSYHIVPLDGQWANRHLGLCYKNWDNLSPAMKNFITYLKD